jgi:hypothetical protein
MAGRGGRYTYADDGGDGGGLIVQTSNLSRVSGACRYAGKPVQTPLCSAMVGWHSVEPISGRCRHHIAHHADAVAIGFLRPDGLDDGERTVVGSFAMTVRRTVIETAGDDHRTLTWIVSPMVPRMMARWSHWQPTQWDQRRRNVPMAADGWLTTRTVCVARVVGLRR